MKKISLCILLATMQVSFGGKEFTKNTSIDEEETSWRDKLPSSNRIKDCAGWWGLTSTVVYGMHWVVKNGYCTPKLDTVGRIGLATLAGAGGIYIASGAREYILEQDCFCSAKERTTWKAFCENANKESFNTGRLVIGTLAAVLLTGWSVVYNPLGFKCMDYVVSNHRTSILTGVILPLTLNAFAAEWMHYCLRKA